MPDPVSVPGMSYTFDLANGRINLEWHIADQNVWRKVLDAIKVIPGRRYSSATKKWSIPNTKEMREWCRASGWNVPEPAAAIERPAPPYNKERVLPGLYSYQEDFLKFSLTRPRLGLFDEQGCIAGDMTVEAIRHGIIWRIPLAHLCRKFHNEAGPWLIRCIQADGVFGYGPILDVIESGIKACVKVTFDDGRELVLTPDHPMKTKDGWIEASKSLNTEIACDCAADCKTPAYRRAVLIEPAGMQMTYDVKVLDHANFLANNTVVHNCGKTVQALSWLRYHGLLPALFVVTASTKRQWEANYKMWLKREDIEVLSGERPAMLEPGKSYVINWDILYKWERSPLSHNLYTQGFKALIGDEVQAIGNRTSQRTKAFMRLAQRIPCLLAMSGTPARSRPVQLWPVLHSIDPATFPDFYAYANRYCNPQPGFRGIEYKGISNGAELHALLSMRTLRRTKAEVMSFLPPKIITTVPCQVDKAQMAAYKEQAKKLKEASEFERSAAMAELFRSAYDLKADACKQWISDFLLTDEKLLVFAWHHAVVDDIAQYLKDRGIGVGILTGTTSPAQKEKIKESFINDPDIRVIVANIQSAGVGIDGLQKACSNCCFVEFTAAPTDHWQAEDRLHRGGQEVPVNVYYLVAPRTIDMTMAYQLDSKAKALAAAIDGDDSRIVKISDMMRKKK